jgi:hypothetical protein
MNLSWCNSWRLGGKISELLERLQAATETQAHADVPC